jgi:hypothetical protein
MIPAIDDCVALAHAFRLSIRSFWPSPGGFCELIGAFGRSIRKSLAFAGVFRRSTAEFFALAQTFRRPKGKFFGSARAFNRSAQTFLKSAHEFFESAPVFRRPAQIFFESVPVFLESERGFLGSAHVFRLMAVKVLQPNPVSARQHVPPASCSLHRRPIRSSIPAVRAKDQASPPPQK